MKSFRLLGYAFILFSSPCFAADVVINEVLATNVFGLRDEDGASSDWVELLNRGDVALNLEGFGLTENPRDPHKFAFPRTILPSGERLLVWCSGKNRVRPRTLDVLDITSTIELQPRYVGPEGWRYLTGAPGAGGPPETWSAPNFDDSKWSAGALPLGFAQVGDEGDFETELPRDTGAVFLRRRFAIEDPSFIDTLILSANYDDGLVVYLNGSLILSLNVPKEATLEFGTRSVVNHTALRRERFDLDEYLDLLVPGENVLAVGLFNRSPGDDSLSNDMYLDLELGCVPQILHSSFGLSGRGESLLLTDPNGLVIDGIRFEAQAADRSYARYPDGTGDWAYHLRPTPLAVNDEARSGRVIPAVPAFEPEGGLYDGELTVRATLEQDAVDLQLRFTVDGTVPTSESDLWNGSYDVAASTTIRCAAFAGEERVSHIATQSYILGADYQLPVLSLVMPPDDFRFVQLSNANSGRLFEREAHAEWIEGGVRQFGLGAGLRLHGNAGRDGGFATKKSYRLYFRDEYGSARLRHPIIPGSVDSFDRLVLRSNIHDAFRVTSRATLVRDQLTRDLHIDMGGVGARGTWCNLLVNSQFRGVYNPTERIDLEFFRSHFPDEVPNWDVIKNTGPTEGSFDTWFNLVQYAVRTDLSIDSNYELAAAQVDLENFVRYMALNIWAQNHDWPGNNWYVARPIREGGRFRFLVWDAEFSFGAQPAGFGADSFQNVFRASGTSLADLFIAFLENERFQRYFLEEFQTLLDGVLSPENVLAHIRRLRNHVAPDMWEETAMVLRPFTTWEANVEVLEEFARNRGRVIQRFVFASPQITVPRVVRADPSEVEPTDEMEVTLRGVGFARGLSIEFGGVPAVEVRGESESRIVAVLPFDARVEGNPPITLVQADGTRMTTRGLLRVSMRPEIHSMEPARAAPGDIVTIRGRVFRTGMRVEFAGAVAEIVGSLTSDEVTVVVPPGGGRVPVRLVNVVPSALASEEVFDFSYAGGVYLRGDSDGDLKVSISDAVRTLRYLFSGSDVPCLAALDANTDGRVGLSDAVRVLGFLFQGVGTLSFPFPHCDVDPLPTLECATDSCSF